MTQSPTHSTVAPVDIVLVPGAYHGGWYYDPIVPALRTAGHRVFQVTLTGLGDRRHLIGGAINLDTHLRDVIELFDHERIDRAMLVGHSYGGMVISGVASELRGRIDALVYLDAVLPADGDSLWNLVGEKLQTAFVAATTDGLTIQPDAGVTDPRAAPHPFATMLQPVRLHPDTYRVRRKVYVWAEGFVDGPFEPNYHRLANNPDWATHRWPAGHDLVTECPKDLEALLLTTASALDRPPLT